jgi:hypothetical protein
MNAGTNCDVKDVSAVSALSNPGGGTKRGAPDFSPQFKGYFFKIT